MPRKVVMLSDVTVRSPVSVGRRATIRYAGTADFIDFRDIVPLVGSVMRAKRLAKSTSRAYRFLKRSRVTPAQRIIGSSMVGANSLLKSSRLKPFGALLYTIDRTGKGALRGIKQGYGMGGTLRAAGVSGRIAIASSRDAVRKVANPGEMFVRSTMRANRLLKSSSASPGRKLLASSGVGAEKLLRSARGSSPGFITYRLHKTGKTVVRRIGRRLKRKR